MFRAVVARFGNAALATLLCAGLAAPPARGQVQALDRESAELVVRRYQASRTWGGRASALLALGPRWHPAGSAAVLDALIGGDRRLLPFGLEALAGCPDGWLAPVASRAIVEELVRLLDDPCELVRIRAIGLLRRIAPFVDGESADSLRSWWREAAPRYEPPLAPGEVRGEGSVESAYIEARLERLDAALSLRSRPLDLVLCIDTSSSMTSAIDGVRAIVRQMVDLLGGLVPDLQLGLVHYKDVGTLPGGAQRLVVLGPGVDAMARALDRLTAVGGGDRLEAVDLAITLALQPEMGWREAAMKHIVIIGDAPPRHDTLERLLPELRQRAFGMKREQDRTNLSAIDVGTASDTAAVFGRLAELGGGYYHRVDPKGTASAQPLLEPLVEIALGREVRDTGRRLLAIYREYALAGCFRTP